MVRTIMRLCADGREADIWLGYLLSVYQLYRLREVGGKPKLTWEQVFKGVGTEREGVNGGRGDSPL